MSKVLKKISASFLLILMLFSVAFNVLDYGYKVYAAGVALNSDGTYTITTENFELILPQSTYELMNEENWKYFLDNYENYYSELKKFTGLDPLNDISWSKNKIKIDATNDISANGTTTISRKTDFNKIRL